MTKSRLAPIFLAAAVALGGCSPLLSGDEPADVVRVGYMTRTGDVVSGTGAVEAFHVGGGFFVIRGDDGKIYLPLNLPAGLERDGARVRFSATLRRELGAIHLRGEFVELKEISAA